ncbi:MAG: alpha/beta fold hydrolase [Thermoprotei archaeon]|jgi:pimeloyl-ACP methyl ester carboxylesterase
MEYYTYVNDLKIRFLNKGEGDPIILLHGYSFNANTWDEISLIQFLSEKYNVYAIDMPYGPKSKSDKFTAESRDEYAEFLKNILLKLNIMRPILLGASISGEVVLRYLSNNYDAMAGIVVGPVGVKLLAHRFNKINVPLLIVWGENDNIASLDDAKLLASSVKGSELYIIKNAGHACYLDKPEEFKSVIMMFLGKYAHSIH